MAKTLNIILIFTVLLSSTGIMLGAHQCGETEVKGVACVCASEGGCQDNCCHTDWEYFQSDLEKQAPVIGMEVPAVKVFAITLLSFFTENNTVLTSRRHEQLPVYRPPIVKRDIPVLLQSFLI